MSVLKRKFKTRFTQTPNEFIEDDRLSHTAFRVGIYLFSRPENWKIWNNEVMKKCRIKDPKTMSKAWNELMELSWLSREMSRDKHGRMTGGFDYYIHDSAYSPKNPNQDETLNREKSTLGKNGDHNKTDLINNTDFCSNKESKRSPEITKEDLEDFEKQVADRMDVNAEDFKKIKNEAAEIQPITKNLGKVVAMIPGSRGFELLKKIGKDAAKIWQEMNAEDVLKEKSNSAIEWLTYRCEIGKPIRSNAEMKLLVELVLKTEAERLSRMMQYSIQRGYPSMYEDFDKSKKQYDVKNKRNSKSVSERYGHIYAKYEAEAAANAGTATGTTGSA